MNGIIAYLTRKHGGNVHEKGIITITSKSLYKDDPKYAAANVADLGLAPCFGSKNEPGQWLCWDFHEMRVRATNYSVTTTALRSWVLESSMDGENWTVIDRQTNTLYFKIAQPRGWPTESFTIAKPLESRFLRLTQTDAKHRGGDELLLGAVEFFGTLSE
jgi:hypothetical protein